MAQNYVGSNNLELLYPSGQFGTRIANGKDASSPRYIFTRLSDLTSIIYNEEDNDNLNYLDDDGFSIEPERFVPLLPMILINGSKGIGTGWSTDIPQYNPRDIVNCINKLLNNEPLEELVPWYRNYEGKFIKTGPKSFINLNDYPI